MTHRIHINTASLTLLLPSRASSRCPYRPNGSLNPPPRLPAFPPIRPGICFIIFLLCSNCFTRRFTSETSTPVIWLLLCRLLPENRLYDLLPCLIILSTLAGVWAANKLQSVWGEDPSRVVIDEMVGTWIVLYVVPVGNLYLGLTGILFFRLFDIFKPLGIRLLEDVSGGWGVMLDDILAGIYGVLCMLLLQWITFCF